MGREGGGWRKIEGESALTSRWTVLLAIPTALVAKHSYLWREFILKSFQDIESIAQSSNINMKK